MASGGWPTDWWADHQSAFPNLMDFHIMNTVGVDNNDQNLIKAAAAQKKRFYPGGDSSDPKVVALDNVFMLMPGGDGYAGFSHMFAMVTADGMKWDGLGVPNPDVKRSEYVVAYMSLAAGQSVLKTLQGPGANGGGNICNNTPDGTAGDKPYTCVEANVDAIATAHCAANANGKKAADMTALRGGNYAMVPSGPCGATCPGECACDAQSHCVAPWLGTRPDAGTSTGAGGAAGNPDAGTASGAGGGGGGAGAAGSAGGTGVAGSTGAGTGGNGATGTGAGGAAAGSSGTGAGGSTTGTGTGTGTATGVGGSTNTGVAGTGATGEAGHTGGGAATGGAGCACALAGGDHNISAWTSGSLLSLALLVARRRRARG
jgi:hypothetical protein